MRNYASEFRMCCMYGLTLIGDLNGYWFNHRNRLCDGGARVWSAFD